MNLLPEKYRNDEELIRLTVEQIKKDFSVHLPELILSGGKEKLFDELHAQISAALTLLRKKNPSAFQSLLYRVDISETIVSKLPSENFCEALSGKIIQREFQKVLTRRFFSNKE